MTHNLERSKSRLNNIQTIEPLLGALRTMSMGAWQMAKNKIGRMRQYEENYHQILEEILPFIKKQPDHQAATQTTTPNLASAIVLVIGSERGLCGKFNDVLAEKALAWIESKKFASHQIWALGARMVRALQKRNITISWRNPLPTGELATFHQAYLATQNWLEQYEAYNFDTFILLYNQIGTGVSYQFTSLNLIPYQVTMASTSNSAMDKPWPPPIIDTDPVSIYNQIIQHFIASKYYQALLGSAAAEHATRYTLMQEAKNNAEDIIEELGRVINAERKKKITQEMQELAVGAGLLDYL